MDKIIELEAINSGNPDNQSCIHVNEVMHVDIVRIMGVLVDQLEEQEEVTIEYTIEKLA